MELLGKSDLDRLTAPERLTLISQLWDSLDNAHLPVSVTQQDELDLRLATLDEDSSVGSLED